MSLNRIYAIMMRQLLDTWKNKTVLIQFVMFPTIACILSVSANQMHLAPEFFVNMFVVMYITMAPILVISTIVGEDKEKGSLQILRMANVKPFEYIFGIGFYVFVLCVLGILFLGFIAKLSGVAFMMFLIMNMVGLLISILIGSIIGLISANQSAASGLSTPAMLIFSFLPMLSMFNTGLHQYSKFIYSQQISDVINALNKGIPWESVGILLLNFLIVLCLYVYVYHQNKFK